VFLTMWESEYSIPACLIAAGLIIFGNIIPPTMAAGLEDGSSRDSRQCPYRPDAATPARLDAHLLHGLLAPRIRALLQAASRALLTQVVEVAAHYWHLHVVRHLDQVRWCLHICDDRSGSGYRPLEHARLQARPDAA